jgi:hypothetical protein
LAAGGAIYMYGIAGKGRKEAKAMKLAEALIERANLQRRLDALKERMTASARVAEGDTPAEDAMALLAEYERVATALLDYIRQINATNIGAHLEPGVSLMDAIAQRDVLRKRQQAYLGLANAAMGAAQRMYGQGEVRYQRVVDVAALRRQADELAREARELDTRLQAANWTVDLEVA